MNWHRGQAFQGGAMGFHDDARFNPTQVVEKYLALCFKRVTQLLSYSSNSYSKSRWQWFQNNK